MPIWLAHRLAHRLAEVRRAGILPYLRPDGKTQVTFEYEDGGPVGLKTVLISTQHQPGLDAETLIKPDLIEHVIRPLVPQQFQDDDYRVLVNPTGSFVLGGPHADCGLTGRKIIVDTYGGAARHGGGAFSGKDPSKVDRSAAYAARWVAKNVVAAGAARAARCRWRTPSASPTRCRSWSRPSAPRRSTPARSPAPSADLRPASGRDHPRPRPAPADLQEDRRVRPLRSQRQGAHLGADEPGRRAQVRAGTLSGPRVVRVLPDEPAIDKTFDYLVPDDLGDQVRVGDLVRVVLHGRRVGGWVVAVGVDPPPGVALRPLAKWSGRGPTPELIELAEWAAWRWAGRPASLLRTASPERVVTGLPARRPARSPPPNLRRIETSWPRFPPPVHRCCWCGCRRRPGRPGGVRRRTRGNALILCPTAASARSVGRARAARACPPRCHPRDWALGAAGATVVGTRAAAGRRWADLAAIVVIDEHDEAHHQEQAPTWHARDVALERARRAGVPCVMTSPCPSLEALDAGRLIPPSRADERAGWPVVDVVDMRRQDPRTGLLPPALVRLLRSDRRVLCVLNRTGRARLLACKACGELARCERCDAAVAQPGDELVCARCGTVRPAVCASCGASRLRTLRQGVTRCATRSRRWSASRSTR